MRIRQLFAVCLPALLLSDGNVYALAAGSGKLLWRFKTGGPVIGRPTVSGDIFTRFPRSSPPPV
jgi:outer membrane protein assembly factor BamB